MLGEREIKLMIIERFLSTKRIDFSSTLINEMNVGGKTRRVDLAYLNGNKIYGIEIKSERDSLDRLEGQLAEYKKYFDKVIVVVAARFVQAVLLMCDSEVEVWCLDGQVLTMVRRGRVNKTVRKEDYLDLMTRREVYALSRFMGLGSSKAPMFELKEIVVGKLATVSKQRVKGFMLDGIRHRFAPASRRFFRAVETAGSVADVDFRLLSPHSPFSFKHELLGS